jgi:predicted Rdx family selenoprotein
VTTSGLPGCVSTWGCDVRQVTLRSDDAGRFEQMKAAVEERRDGAEPSNAELVRLMMDQFDPEEL